MRTIVIGGQPGSIGGAIAAELSCRDHRVLKLSRGASHRLDLNWAEDEIGMAMRSAVDYLDGLDALVVCSGMGAAHGPGEADEDVVEAMFRVNCMGPLLAYWAVQQDLLRSHGQVLFLGSTMAQHGARGFGLYGGCKAFIEGFVRSEAKTWKRLRLNVLAPGWVETNMTADLKPELRAAAEEWMPMGRFLQPHEVANRALEILESGETGRVIEYLGEDLVEE